MPHANSFFDSNQNIFVVEFRCFWIFFVVSQLKSKNQLFGKIFFFCGFPTDFDKNCGRCPLRTRFLTLLLKYFFRGLYIFCKQFCTKGFVEGFRKSLWSSPTHDLKGSEIYLVEKFHWFCYCFSAACFWQSHKSCYFFSQSCSCGRFLAVFCVFMLHTKQFFGKLFFVVSQLFLTKTVEDSICELFFFLSRLWDQQIL